MPVADDDLEYVAACLAATDGSHPGELLERRELEAQVQKCISALAEDYREVLVMRDIQGFSYEEIQDVLRIPDGTVKSRLSRARVAMKDCLKKIMTRVREESDKKALRGNGFIHSGLKFPCRSWRQLLLQCWPFTFTGQATNR